MATKYIALTPYENFVYALKAKESIRQYPHRLDKFLTFLEFEGTIPEKWKENSAMLRKFEEQERSFHNP
jgi:hypothetical protein